VKTKLKITNFFTHFYLNMATNAEGKMNKEICNFLFFAAEHKVRQRQVH